MEYEIDPLSLASPDMDDAEFAALKQSIAEIGQLVSIVVFDGRIIDGRKRYRACRELGKEPSVLTLHGDADPVKHAQALNLFRTQYSASQRAMYASVLATGKRGHNFRAGVEGKAGMVNLPSLPPSYQSVADMAGISVSLIGWAKRVRQSGIPEVASAVERGDLALHTARQIVDKPKHEQSAALQAAKDAPRRKDGARIPLPTGGRHPRMHRRGDAELAAKAIEVLSYTAQELERVMEGVGEIPDRDRRRAQLDRVATIVRQARSILKGGPSR